MHDQPSLDPAEAEDREDSSVLQLLLDPDLRTPLSVDELTREIGKPIAVVDALRDCTAQD
jgi:hypothetical protein